MPIPVAIGVVSLLPNTPSALYDTTVNLDANAWHNPVLDPVDPGLQLNYNAATAAFDHCMVPFSSVTTEPPRPQQPETEMPHSPATTEAAVAIW